jgi:hypothetical protein
MTAGAAIDISSMEVLLSTLAEYGRKSNIAYDWRGHCDEDRLCHKQIYILIALPWKITMIHLNEPQDRTRTTEILQSDSTPQPGDLK